MNVAPTEDGTIVLVADTHSRLLSVFVPTGGVLEQVLVGLDVVWCAKGWQGESVVPPGVAVSILVRECPMVQLEWDGQLTLQQGREV